jgi:hypothetical protein
LLIGLCQPLDISKNFQPNASTWISFLKPYRFFAVHKVWTKVLDFGAADYSYKDLQQEFCIF